MYFMKSHKRITGAFAGIVLALIAAVICLLGLKHISTDQKNGDTQESWISSFVDELMKKSWAGTNDKVLLFDFLNYEGEDLNPGGYFSADIEQGEIYTFSFDYCIEGESLGMTCINAANEWGMGSEVSFGNEPLQGKGNKSFTFTADYPALVPVFQAYVPKGCANVYVWNITLTKEGTTKNLLKSLTLDSFSGKMADEDLIYYVDVDTDALEGTVVEMQENPVIFFDYTKYDGDNECPGAGLSMDVEVGASYTFSYEYCVIGDAKAITCINAANEWGMGSNVKLSSSPLIGKDVYTTTFTADYPTFYPVFQCFTPSGTAQLYVWNLKLVKTGTEENLMEQIALKSFQGALAECEGCITFADVDPTTLVPTATVRENPVILMNFEKYKGDNECPGTGLMLDAEVGAGYTFSFDYCVVGDALGITCINAASEWGLGSNVKLDDTLLVGKGSYKSSFTADYSIFYPMLQCFMPNGTAQFYVWNLKLVKNGTDVNLLEKIALESFQGALAECEGCVSFADIDPEVLEPTWAITIDSDGILNMPDNLAKSTWLLDFEKYNGKNETPGMQMAVSVEKGSTYTFSFDYCVVGKATGITCINAANEWGLGSDVKFDSNPLIGKDTYTVTFKADYPTVIPVIQANIPAGKAKLYVWNLKLVKHGKDGNLMRSVDFSSVEGDLKKAGCISKTSVNTADLKPTITLKANIANNTWLFDFSKYKGSNETPGVNFSVDVEKGQKYRFSFQYCVIGETLGTTCINAASEWGLGSNVKFDSTPLQGKGTYLVEFTADYQTVIPVIQSHIPQGAPQVYVWDLKLEKVGSGTNLLSNMSWAKFQGALAEAELVTLSDVNTGQLVPTVTELNYLSKHTWLIDFVNYKGSDETPGMFFSAGVEKGKEYTFSFDYCVTGEEGTDYNISVINAMKEWSGASKVEFTNNQLEGKGSYEISFTADTEEILPVIQSAVGAGKTKLYVWNLSLTKKGETTNLLDQKTQSSLEGAMVTAGLVSKSDADTSKLTGLNKPAKLAGNTWLIEFDKYTGEDNTPGMYFSAGVEKGKEYTFRFDYCVTGEEGTDYNISVINAMKEWSGASKVEFTNNQLEGKGSYEISFTADTEEILPVIQSAVGAGKTKLYVWNLSLTKKGETTNLLAQKTQSSLQGAMVTAGLVSKSDADTSTLNPIENPITVIDADIPRAIVLSDDEETN